MVRFEGAGDRGREARWMFVLPIEMEQASPSEGEARLAATSQPCNTNRADARAGPSPHGRREVELAPAALYQSGPLPLCLELCRMTSTMSDDLRSRALVYRRLPKPGKLEVIPTKPLGKSGSCFIRRRRR